MFCLPYAGGGASIYLRWSKAFPPEIAVCPVLLPGREGAIGLPPIADGPALIAALADAVTPLLDRPYAFFGCSLGARLAYGLTHELLRRGLPAPVLLAVAACRQPASPPHRPGAFRLPEDEFIAYLRELGGTPAEIFANRALLDLMVPMLRADFSVVEAPLPRQPLPCPITACAGTEDSTAPPSALIEWAGFTRSRFALRVFPGGHFFLREQLGPLAAALVADIGRALAALPQSP
jgi:medium-chain acyl-[acyl-carrier-protein] hydrolase